MESRQSRRAVQSRARAGCGNRIDECNIPRLSRVAYEFQGLRSVCRWNKKECQWWRGHSLQSNPPAAGHYLLQSSRRTPSFPGTACVTREIQDADFYSDARSSGESRAGAEVRDSSWRANYYFGFSLRTPELCVHFRGTDRGAISRGSIFRAYTNAARGDCRSIEH